MTNTNNTISLNNTNIGVDSLRGRSVKIGTNQRSSAWPLRKDDTHESRSVNKHTKSGAGEESLLLFHRAEARGRGALPYRESSQTPVSLNSMESTGSQKQTKGPLPEGSLLNQK